MKMLWDELDNYIKVSVWLSECAHLEHLPKIEELVASNKVDVIEAQLRERGQIWNLNKDVYGSEDLYIETALHHVETFYKAKNLRKRVLSLLEKTVVSHDVRQKDLTALLMERATRLVAKK